MRDDDGPREKSRALPMRYYRDPLEVLIAEESTTCAGCASEGETFGRRHCLKNRKYGRRCSQYVERGGGG